MMNKTSWIAAIICGIFTYIICTILKTDNYLIAILTGIVFGVIFGTISNLIKSK